MRRISRVAISGLFQHLSHDLELRSREPTILTGPNGVGKTSLLVLIRAALNLDVRALHALPFSQLDIYFSDGWQLSVARTRIEDLSVRMRISAKRNGKKAGKTFEAGEEELAEIAEIPSWVERVSENRWYDGRNGSVVNSRILERRYDLKLDMLPRDQLKEHPDILTCVTGLEPILIDTKRLDSLVTELRPRAFNSDSYPRPVQTRIQQYIHQIRWQVEEARRASVVATQSADLSFASRALAAAHARVNEAALHKRYDTIVEQYEDLSQNGLAIGEAPLDFPENTTPTVRRILNVFLDDWENRLEPLRPVNSKLKLLRRILDGKLAVTGKKSRITDLGTLQIVGPRNNLIRVSKLSSGEQHLVALFAMLLFSASPASVILIDEPEISLHAAWKHSFLDDISEVARLVNLQVLLATHSSGIVNGRWDLTEELAYTPPHSGELTEALAIKVVDTDSEEEFE